MFIGEPGGSNRSQVSNTSRGLLTLTLTQGNTVVTYYGDDLLMSLDMHTASVDQHCLKCC